MATHSHHNKASVNTSGYAKLTADFRHVTEGSSVDMFINGIKVSFVAGTDFEFNNSDQTITAANFKQAVDNYLAGVGLLTQYTTSTTGAVFNIVSSRPGTQYDFNGKVNSVSNIVYQNAQDAGGGAAVQNFAYTAQNNSIYIVDCYPSGNPDLFELSVNGTKKMSTTMNADPAVDHYEGSNNYSSRQYIRKSDNYDFGIVQIHETYNLLTRSFDTHFIGSDLGQVPTHKTAFEFDTKITDIDLPTTKVLGAYNYASPQRIWSAVNAGDSINIKVVGGSGLTGYAFFITEVSVDNSNDIRLNGTVSDTQTTITADQIELIAEKVFIENLQGYSPDSHTHDDRYITIPYLTGVLANLPKTIELQYPGNLLVHDDIFINPYTVEKQYTIKKIKLKLQTAAISGTGNNIFLMKVNGVTVATLTMTTGATVQDWTGLNIPVYENDSLTFNCTAIETATTPAANLNALIYFE